MNKPQQQLASYSNWAALPLRAVLGATFIAHGRPKLYGAAGGKFGDGLREVEAMLRAQGTPQPRLMARLVTLVEIGGGFALLFGFATRLFALLLAATMVVAIVQVKFKQGFVGGYEFDLNLFAALLALAITGGGPLSADRLVGLP